MCICVPVEENLCHLEMSALLEEQWGWPSIRRQTKEGDSLFLLSLVPGTSISDSLNPFLGFYDVPAVGKYGMGYPQGNMLLLVKGQSMEEYPWMLPRQVLALLDREGFSKKKVRVNWSISEVGTLLRPINPHFNRETPRHAVLNLVLHGVCFPKLQWPPPLGARTQATPYLAVLTTSSHGPANNKVGLPSGAGRGAMTSLHGERWEPKREGLKEGEGSSSSATGSQSLSQSQLPCAPPEGELGSGVGHVGEVQDQDAADAATLALLQQEEQAMIDHAMMLSLSEEAMQNVEGGCTPGVEAHLLEEEDQEEVDPVEWAGQLGDGLLLLNPGEFPATENKLSPDPSICGISLNSLRLQQQHIFVHGGPADMCLSPNNCRLSVTRTTPTLSKEETQTAEPSLLTFWSVVSSRARKGALVTLHWLVMQRNTPMETLVNESFTLQHLLQRLPDCCSGPANKKHVHEVLTLFLGHLMS